MAERGTFEIVGEAVAELLSPLAERLDSVEEARALFIELGLNPPADFLGRPGLEGKLRAGATAAAKLPPKISDLLDAIESEDVSAVIAAGKAMSAEITAVVAAVQALAAEIESAAGALSGVSAADLRQFAEQLPERMLNLLAIEWLDRNHEDALAVLTFVGLVDEIVERAQVDDARRPTVVRRTLRPDRVPGLLGDPFRTLADVYGWGRADFDAPRLLDGLRRLFAVFGWLSYVEPKGANGRPELRLLDTTVRPRPDVSPPGLELVLQFDLAGDLEVKQQLAPGLELNVGAKAAMASSTALTVTPPASLAVDPPSVPVSGALAVELKKTNATAGEALLLLGLAGGPRIEAGALRARGEVGLDWNVTAGLAEGEVTLEVALDDGKVVIALTGADGFLAAILPSDGLTLEVDLGLGWSSERGLFFKGSAGLEVDVPVDKAVGPVKLSAVHLGLGSQDGGLALEASAAIAAKLGPFALAIDRMGFLAVVTFPESGGNLEFANLAFQFKPPSGIGMSIDAGVVKGGGYIFLDPPKGEYIGMLELAIGPVSVKAIGILTTKLPGGQPGWALLLLIYFEFPAVQLGFGFTLNGVGGILGLQHGVSVQALQSGMRTGALDAVLFPDNPVANAPTIINQLRVVFPVTPRALTIGPAVQIGWGTPSLVKISLGIILQLDNVLGAGEGAVEFTRIVLVGQLEVGVPPLEELGDDVPQLVKLLVDVVGAYETREKQLSIDARLRDSHIALLPITGSLCVRANFGDRPGFILAVGGFHPRFTDLPPGLPQQDRLGIEMRFGILVVRIAAYVAITSNSFQFGAEANVLAQAAGFRVEAYVGFDALFIFEPVFHFEIDFRIGASIRYKSISIASADLRGSLAGPGHWRIAGKASISLLFFSVTVGFDEEWGEAPVPELPSVRVGEQLAAALRDPINWVAQLPTGGDMLTTLRRVPADGAVVAHPLGELAVTQKVVPLQLDITRVGQARPADGNRFDVTGVTIGETSVTPTFSKEHFARAQYLDLTEEQKLSTPSFEQFPAGVSVSTAGFKVPAAAASQVAFEPGFETVYLKQPGLRIRERLPFSILVSHARIGAAAKSQLRTADTLRGDGALKVSVEGIRYAVADEERLAEVAVLSDDATTSFSFATQTAARHDGAVQVIESVELAVGP